MIYTRDTRDAMMDDDDETMRYRDNRDVLPTPALPNTTHLSTVFATLLRSVAAGLVLAINY
jgi:hypothetical protein